MPPYLLQTSSGRFIEDFDPHLYPLLQEPETTEHLPKALRFDTRNGAEDFRDNRGLFDCDIVEV